MIRFEWTEIDAGVHECRRTGGSRPLGHAVHTPRGAWFSRVGHADLAPVTSEAAAKAALERAIRAAEEPMPLRCMAKIRDLIAVGPPRARKSDG